VGAVITGILLAAGQSSRFGADKLLHPMIDDTPMAVVSLRSLNFGVDNVVAVIRPDKRELAARLIAERAQVVECMDADQGMGASLACGARATAHSDGWLVALADMPHIRPTTVKLVASEVRTGALLAAPAYRGKRGHPVGFAARFSYQLVDLSGDTGARTLFDRHNDSAKLLACNDPGILLDVDIPADLERIEHKIGYSGHQVTPNTV
jgi:molybdenum cofactor cytidylyltransferase